jgi:hypothetical protein
MLGAHIVAFTTQLVHITLVIHEQDRLLKRSKVWRTRHKEVC